jgi:hypothetical protein
VRFFDGEGKHESDDLRSTMLRALEDVSLSGNGPVETRVTATIRLARRLSNLMVITAIKLHLFEKMFAFYQEIAGEIFGIEKYITFHIGDKISKI